MAFIAGDLKDFIGEKGSKRENKGERGVENGVEEGVEGGGSALQSHEERKRCKQFIALGSESAFAEFKL